MTDVDMRDPAARAAAFYGPSSSPAEPARTDRAVPMVDDAYSDLAAAFYGPKSAPEPQSAPASSGQLNMLDPADRVKAFYGPQQAEDRQTIRVQPRPAPVQAQVQVEADDDAEVNEVDAEEVNDTEQDDADTEEFSESSVDPEILQSFKSTVQDLKIDDALGQKILARMAPAIAERQAAQVEALHAEWEKASRTDAEFGRSAFDKNLQTARGVLAEFGNAKLRDVLNKTGLGSHPELVRLLVKVGKRISNIDEDDDD